jgi:acyl dehydratase
MAITEAIAVGQELPSLQKDLSQRRIDVYSGVRPRSIHTDEAWAHAKGFGTTLAQGMMSTAYVSEMMTRFLGAGFVKGGTLSMAFIKPVYAGDRLTVHGVVKETRPRARARGSSSRCGARTSAGRRPRWGRPAGSRARPPRPWAPQPWASHPTLSPEGRG